MKKHTIATVEELKAVLAAFGPDALFRGQVRHFGTDDAPKMNTSFSRNGCIPPLMLRWSHYSGFILAALLGRDQREISTEFTQAVLQHYGWRSFYLDASSNPAVSAWFASHAFSGSRSIELCEDCFEAPVFLVKLMAKYAYEEGTGFLYVLSKEAMAKRGLGLVDLSSIELPDCRPRFHVQAAWLVGPLYEDLPVDCILATIQGPRSIFRALAQESGIVETGHLFPNTDEDPVLELLTSMPWQKMRLPNEKKKDLKFFQQAFEFPEYHDSFRKHNPPHIAYYEGTPALAEKVAPDVRVFDVPEIVVYGFADPIAERFPRVAEIVQGEGRHFVFEIDSLVRRPGRLSTEYLKGVAISKCDNSLFSVADFAVDHPGRQMAGCGINMGWHYRIEDDGRWVREVTPDDCPCENNSIHQHHLSMLTILEDRLGDDPASVVRRPPPA
ncbi:MAG: hypothetical protein E5W65_30265 [Mesorhizobium sp.]|uniref:hypothetical protein n=1 Tax=Mesorhizobium sp. TaxID=1871066 RepID=UPI00122A5687|nr:hypothetical protein [Mesorhizobium sp.]TIT31067.1 MAG: hypothetical protein E5W65_30265 [Mesorhizobium sp.]